MSNDQLRQLGLKVTSARLKILELLRTAKHHLSAEDIYQHFRDSDEDIGLATIYRVLAQFETAGIIKRRHFEEGISVFELNEGDHHDHLVCAKCGHIEEFVDDIIEQRQQAIVEEKNYQMTEHTLIIYGICPTCLVK